MRKTLHVMPALLVGGALVLGSAILAQAADEPPSAGPSATAPADEAAEATTPADAGVSFTVQVGGSAASDQPVPLALRQNNTAITADTDAPADK